MIDYVDVASCAVTVAYTLDLEAQEACCTYSRIFITIVIMVVNFMMGDSVVLQISTHSLSGVK